MPKTRRPLNRPTKKRKKSSSQVFEKLTFHRLNWLEVIAIVLSLWFIIFPKPYVFLLSALLCIPIMGVLINGFERPSIASLVEITRQKGAYKYDVADFIDFPAWAILFRLLSDYTFENFKSLVLPGTMSAVIIVSVLLLTHDLIVDSKANKWWIYSSIIFNVCLYSYAGTYAANCAFDQSTPEVYKTTVLDKSIAHSRRGRSYRVKIAPWGHERDNEYIFVSAIEYAALAPGDEVAIDLKKGLFNIPWYYIEDRK